MPPRPKPRDKGYGARLKLEQAIEKLREADLTPITGDDPLISNVVNAAIQYSNVVRVSNWWSAIFFPNYMRICGPVPFPVRVMVLELVQKKFDQSVPNALRGEALYAMAPEAAWDSNPIVDRQFATGTPLVSLPSCHRCDACQKAQTLCWVAALREDGQNCSRCREKKIRCSLSGSMYRADRSSKDYSPSAEANADQPQLPLTNPPTPLATSLQSSPPSAQEPVVALSLPPSAPTPEGILAVYGRLVQRARGPAHGAAASAQSKIAIEGAVAVLEGDVRNELEQLILRSGYQS